MTAVEDHDYTDRCVLITGGTGSFGSTMVRKLLTTEVREVRVLSRDEAKQDAMRHDIDDARVRFYLGDVREPSSVDRGVAGADYVFHAAALKQVPSCEFFPMEAVRTNVLGSLAVIDAAERHGVTTVVCLSTDKAVYPVNAMGMSKALMEKVAQAHARTAHAARTVVACVRYGNVMYSRGSVIPLFIHQIRSGHAVTITDLQMTRFMMSLTESVALVEFAFAHADPGDVFIKKAPAATLADLATALFELFEVEPNVKVIGMRHGEKLHETLASREEVLRSEDHGSYLRMPLDAPELNYEQYFEEGEVEAAYTDNYDSRTARRLDVGEVKELLLTLPEVRAQLAEASSVAYAAS
jgi:UDP-N-acetylglucosamine 4,6-dehydratase/5-epimerase